MSHYRNLGGGKRDSNEPQIMKRFAIHGWHAEQISGNRLWDLLVLVPSEDDNHMTTRHAYLVDVKEPKGKVTPAQEKKWKALRAKGIPVYVVRTTADVDALVRGALEPWRPPDECTCEDDDIPFCAVHVEAPRHGANPTPARVKGKLKPSANYAPPDKSTPRGSRTWPMATTAVVPSAEDAAIARAVLAAQEAGETFAPGPVSLNCGNCGSCMECMRPAP